MRRALVLILTLAEAVVVAQVRAQDQLPDMITVPDFLYHRTLDNQALPGRTLLRLSNATPNIGLGRLEIVQGEIVNDTQVLVNQRIYRADGTFWERPAGTFAFHDEHDHVHFEGWASYRLRAITEDGGVGDVLSEGEKVSFCLVDFYVYDRTNPNFRAPGFYSSCGFTMQGITPGWADLYSLQVPGQYVDITGIPDGMYWLESEVDPDDNILEEDETNNASRVKVALGPPPPAEPDPYEENDSIAQVTDREEGGTGSPNLGLVNARREIDNLSLEDTGDYFRFRMNKTAGPGDYVQIESPYMAGDMNIILYGADGRFIAARASPYNFEQISLNLLAAGSYDIFVQRNSGQIPGYKLTIDPPPNAPPTIELTRPEQPGVWLERGIEAVRAEWVASDPEGDPLKVSLFRDRDTALDEGTVPIEGHQDLDGGAGTADVDTAGMEVGAWFLYAKVSDGGAEAGSWAPGPFILYVKGDVDFNGIVDKKDLKAIVRAIVKHNFPPEWLLIIDMDRDGDVDGIDIRLLIKAALPRNPAGR